MKACITETDTEIQKHQRKGQKGFPLWTEKRKKRAQWL